jgi:hypothetical protein
VKKLLSLVALAAVAAVVRASLDDIRRYLAMRRM